MKDGKRKGAGRPKGSTTVEEKMRRATIGVRLPKYMIKWLKDHKEPAGRIIEGAVKTIMPILIIVMTGCTTSLSTDLRKEGFVRLQQSLESVPEIPELDTVIELKNVKIHIVGHRNRFDYAKAAAYGSPVAGYARPNNEIWLLGKMVEGKIVLDQAILGHELKHLLHFKNPNVVDPDRMEDIGM